MNLTDEISVDAQSGVASAQLMVCEDADFLADHFPGAPMLPGLLMMEMAVRAARRLWCQCEEDEFAAELHCIEQLRVIRRVVPHEILIVETRISETGGAVIDRATMLFDARARVADEAAMRARFRLKRVFAMRSALLEGANTLSDNA
jgi:3-hydroxymyristoyl/3-hydroxydecanoyl-(acyl carrier protein) dehydratase